MWNSREVHSGINYSHVTGMICPTALVWYKMSKKHCKKHSKQELRRGYTWTGVKFDLINIKRELLELKWVGNATRQLTPSSPPLSKKKRVPGWHGTVWCHLLILPFKFQFFKSIKSSTLHTFLNLNYPLRKMISFPKCPKITYRFTQNRLTVVNSFSSPDNLVPSLSFFFFNQI